MTEDLETTLRIIFDKDELRRSVEEAAREAGKAAGAAFSEGFAGRGGGGGPSAPRTGGGGGGATPSGGGTRSSSDPAVLDEARGGGGEGGGGGGRRGGGRSRPSGGGTRSPADGDGGGGGAAPGGGGGGRGPVDHSKPPPRDLHGRFLKPGSIDYMSYMAGPSLTRDTRMLMGAFGPGQGGMFGAAMSLGATHFGDSLMAKAKERIEFIDQQRREGVAPEDMASRGATMGALRYAGPIGALATTGASLLTAHIGKGLSLQEQYSTRYGQLAPMLASLKRQGPVIGSQSNYLGFGTDNVNSYLRQAALPQYGGQNSEEAFATLGAYESIGYRRGGGFDPKPLKGAGISDEAIAAYGSVGRLGASNADPTRLSAAMGAAGYAPNVTNQVLQTIAENTRSMAMRGIKIDMDSSVAWMEKALAAGKSPDVAAAAMANMNNVAQEPLDIFQGVGRRVASASAMMAVMSDPRARGDSFMSVVNAAADTESVRRRMMTMFDPKSDLGQLNAFGATGVLGMEGVEGSQRPGPQRLAPLSEAYDANDPYNPYTFRSESAKRGGELFSVLQGSKAFAGQQWGSRAADIGAMQHSWINKLKGALKAAYEAVPDDPGDVPRWGMENP